MPPDDVSAMPAYEISTIVKPLGIKNLGHTRYRSTLLQIVFWVVQSLVYFTVAKLLFHKPVKLAEVLSSIGYAIFPGILIIAASLLPLIELSIPMLIILAVYRLATCTVALQQLLNLKPFVAFMLVIVGSGTGFLCLGFFIKLSNALVN